MPLTAEHPIFAALRASAPRKVVVVGRDVQPTLPSPRGLTHAAASALLKEQVGAARDDCIAEALQRVGAPVAALGRAESGCPLWPSGLVGSIAHKTVLVVVAVARSGDHRSLGVDLDRLESDRDGIASLVAPEGLPSAWPVDLAPAVVHVVKEAVFKAQFPLTGDVLGFDDVVVAWQGAFDFRARLPDHTIVSGAVVSAGKWLAALAYLDP